MVPAQDTERRFRDAEASPQRLKIWVRGAILVIVAGLVTLFVVAARLNPYDQEGKPLAIGTHRQLGMPTCQFVQRFGRPCPTCGMTTSFALLMHGDVAASLRANFAGTLLAIGLIVLIPWGGLSALRGRWLFIRAVEWWMLGGVVAAIVLALVRWAILVGVPWLFGFG